MAINKRSKSSNVEVEKFIGGAEKDRSWNETSELRERIEARNTGRKYTLSTLVGTEQQHQLLKFAAKKLGVSQIELIRRYLFENLERDFGEEYPPTKTS